MFVGLARAHPVLSLAANVNRQPTAASRAGEWLLGRGKAWGAGVASTPAGVFCVCRGESSKKRRCARTRTRRAPSQITRAARHAALMAYQTPNSSKRRSSWRINTDDDPKRLAGDGGGDRGSTADKTNASGSIAQGSDASHAAGSSDHNVL